MNDIRQNCIFGDNAVPYIEELQQYISKLDSFDQKILEFEMCLWNNKTITSPPVLLEHVDNILDIFNKLHNKNDTLSEQIRENLRNALSQYLLVLHVSIQKYNKNNISGNLEIFKKTIPLIKESIGILSAKKEKAVSEKETSLSEQMLQLVDKIGQHITEQTVDHAFSIFDRIKKNRDIEKTVEQILDKIEGNQTIIGLSDSVKLTEAVKNNKNWLKDKKREKINRIIGGAAITTFVIGIIGLITGNRK